MVEPVNNGWQLSCVLASLMLAVAIGPVNANEALQDPTRPSTATGAVVGAGAVASSGPVLQSVLISSGRRVAVISGQTVRTGDKVGDARVVKITETEVLLDDGKDVKTLKLYPGIGKRISRVAGPVKAAER